MKIVVCASIDFTPQIKQAKEQLEKMGHSVDIPKYSQKIIAGEVTLEEFMAEKNARGDGKFREDAEEDLILRYYNLIKESDAILVLNVEKKGIAGYIGANVFLEIGFAYALEKKIFLYNNIPEMMHKDEVVAMKPIVINQDFSKINK
jgi:nucleoside 2-deoxyribosyltransferase